MSRNNQLYFNTISHTLESVLRRLMKARVLQDFRLVGGTALSLHLGHRMSVDIDMFTDAPYQSISFEEINSYIIEEFAYTSSSYAKEMPGLGLSYYIGESADEAVKLDLYYTDTFIGDVLTVEGIRMAQLEDIISMKLEVISRKGRKKDFWDIYELLKRFSLNQMLGFHNLRYPYSHNRSEIINGFMQIAEADFDFDPICLRGNYWEIIKLDLMESVSEL